MSDETEKKDIAYLVDPNRSSSKDLVHVVPGRSDKEIAEEIKQKVVQHLRSYCTFLDECKELGFEINSTVAPNNWNGKHDIAMLKVVKVY